MEWAPHEQAGVRMPTGCSLVDGQDEGEQVEDELGQLSLLAGPHLRATKTREAGIGWLTAQGRVQAAHPWHSGPHGVSAAAQPRSRQLQQSRHRLLCCQPACAFRHYCSQHLPPACKPLTLPKPSFQPSGTAKAQLAWRNISVTSARCCRRINCGQGRSRAALMARARQPAAGAWAANTQLGARSSSILLARQPWHQQQNEQEAQLSAHSAPAARGRPAAPRAGRRTASAP